MGDGARHFLGDNLPELMETRQLLESLFNNTNDAIIIADLDLNIVRVNPAFEKTFGWTENEILGHPIPFFPPGYERQLQETTQKLHAGEEISAFTTVRQRKDGTLLPVSLSISPIHDMNGHVIATASITRDISKLVAITEELRVTKQELESLINTTTDAISFYDVEGRFLRINPAWTKLYGWDEEEVRTLTGLAVTPDDKLEEWYQLFERVKLGLSISDFETVRKTKDGRRIEVSISLSPIRDDEGKITATAAIIRDIGDRKAAEEMLRRTEKLTLTGQLAAGVAHEIRNPLTALKGFVQLLQETGSNQNYCRIILEEVDRIEEILNEVLILAKPEKVAYTQLSVNRLIHHVVTLLSAQAILKNVEIRYQVKEDLPRIEGIEGQLKQLMINLLKNAIESMSEGGVVEIDANRYGSHHVKVCINDNGCGIPPERLSRLGEPFYTTKEKGTGLGMMICHKIVENHHGLISVESSIGKGTTVEIVMPIKQN